MAKRWILTPPGDLGEVRASTASMRFFSCCIRAPGWCRVILLCRCAAIIRWTATTKRWWPTALPDRGADARQDPEAEVLGELAGLDGDTLDMLLPQKLFPGNQPSTTLALDAITPHTLGMLLAMYEHKVFVQGVIWGN